MPITRLLPLVLLVLACTGALASRADAALTVGLGDQKTDMWQDPRFAALEIRQVRLIVAYDEVLKGDFSRYDAWMAAAQARGADVLLSINHATNSYTRLPSTAQYRTVIRTLRARYPFVTTWSAWNEANHRTQPTSGKPRRAAQLYNVLRAECRGCRIVAADVLDQRGMDRWLRTFKRYAKRPKIWGLHNYQDANHFRSWRASGTYRMLKLVRGDIWLTEAGGIVRFGSRYGGGRTGAARAARATRQTFALARRSSRIKRVYLYHWNAQPRFVTWDSGLVDGRGRARPALEVLRREVNRARRARGLAAVGRLPSG